MISLKQLNYALAVAKTRHFKKAAELSSVSQSALSTAVAELESQLGIQIFERDNKRVLITPEGEQLLQLARTIKLGVEDLQVMAQQFKAPLTTPMTIGMIPTIAPYLLPKVAPAIKQQYPDFQFTVVEEQSQILLDMLRSGDIDTAVLALPYPTDGLHTFSFWQEDFYLVTHDESDYVKKKKLSSADIRQQDLLLLREGHCLTGHALAVCQIAASETERNLAGASLYTLIQMVAARMGSTLVPEMALDQLLSTGSHLHAIHVDEQGPHREIAFLSRLNYAGVDNIQRLMQLCKQELQGYFQR